MPFSQVNTLGEDRSVARRERALFPLANISAAWNKRRHWDRTDRDRERKRRIRSVRDGEYADGKSGRKNKEGKGRGESEYIDRKSEREKREEVEVIERIRGQEKRKERRRGKRTKPDRIRDREERKEGKSEREEREDSANRRTGRAEGRKKRKRRGRGPSEYANGKSGKKKKRERRGRGDNIVRQRKFRAGPHEGGRETFQWWGSRSNPARGLKGAKRK